MARALAGSGTAAQAAHLSVPAPLCNTATNSELECNTTRRGAGAATTQARASPPVFLSIPLFTCRAATPSEDPRVPVLPATSVTSDGSALSHIAPAASACADVKDVAATSEAVNLSTPLFKGATRTPAPQPSTSVGADQKTHKRPPTPAPQPSPDTPQKGKRPRPARPSRPSRTELTDLTASLVACTTADSFLGSSPAFSVHTTLLERKAYQAKCMVPHQRGRAREAHATTATATTPALTAPPEVATQRPQRPPRPSRPHVVPPISSTVTAREPVYLSVPLFVAAATPSEAEAEAPEAPSVYLSVPLYSAFDLDYAPYAPLCCVWVESIGLVPLGLTVPLSS